MGGVKFIPYNEKKKQKVLDNIAKQEEEAKKEAEKPAKKGKGGDKKDKGAEKKDAKGKPEPKKEESKKPVEAAKVAAPKGPAPILPMQYKTVNKDAMAKLNECEATLSQSAFMAGS